MLDLYCERLDPGFWAEPLNALTNLAFLVAAWACWHLARRSGALNGSIIVLIGLMASIGIGSGLFHTFATGWARLLDVLPILLFQVFFLWVYLRRVAEVRWAYSALAVGGFLVVSLIVRELPHSVEWSLQYVPALVVVAGLGVYHYMSRKHERWLLLAAAGLFMVSLVFRTMDMVVCPYIPIGTHFIWHVLNAVVLYLVFRGLIANWPNNAEEP